MLVRGGDKVDNANPEAGHNSFHYRKLSILFNNMYQ